MLHPLPLEKRSGFFSSKMCAFSSKQNSINFFYVQLNQTEPFFPAKTESPAQTVCLLLEEGLCHLLKCSGKKSNSGQLLQIYVGYWPVARHHLQGENVPDHRSSYPEKLLDQNMFTTCRSAFELKNVGTKQN